MSDFFDTTIGEQITLQRGFDITKKQQEAGCVPVVSSGGISSYHNEAKVNGPGVVLGRKGTLGTVFYIEDNYWPHDTSLWVKDFKGNTPRFVYYFFKNISTVIKKMDVGAANPALNRNHVHPMKIKWPIIKVQDFIVKILSKFDQKIQLNRQINQTLESMAQAIFQSWFVAFEPVKAKITAREQWQILTDDERTEWLNELLEMQDYFKTCLLELTAKAGLSDDENVQLESSLDLISCRGHGPEGSENLDIGLNNLRKEWQSKIAGPALQSACETLYLNIAAMTAISSRDETSLADMSADEFSQLYKTASLFPERLVESELGEIPEGWEVLSLDHIANYQNGLALQKFRPEPGAEYLPVVKIAQLKKGFSDSEEKASININPKCIIDNGDVVFSWSGSLMVDVWCGGMAALNQHLFKVTSNHYPKWFYYQWTKHHLAEFQRIAEAKAVTMGHIKREHLKSAYCFAPSSDILSLIGSGSANMLEKQISSRLEAQSLELLRDSLLPKLLSGELDMSSLSDIEPAAMDV
jgi:restriction endonuclease S subunit